MSKQPPPGRKYPSFYEKAVPIALIIIASAILILLIVIFAVFFRLIPGA